MDTSTPQAVSVARKRLQRSLSLSMDGEGQGLLPNPFLHHQEERTAMGPPASMTDINLTASELYQVQKKSCNSRAIKATIVPSPPPNRRESVPQLPPVNGAVELDSSSRTSVSEHTLSHHNTASSLDEHALIQAANLIGGTASSSSSIRHPPVGRYGRRISSPAIFPLEKNHSHPVFNTSAADQNAFKGMNPNNPLRRKSRKITASKLKHNKSENSLLQSSWPMSRSPVWNDHHHHTNGSRIEEGGGNSNNNFLRHRTLPSPSFTSVSGAEEQQNSRNYVFVYNEKKERDDSAPKSMFKVEKQRHNSGTNNNSSPIPNCSMDTDQEEQKDEDVEGSEEITAYVVPTVELLQQRDREMEMLAAENSKTDRIVNWLIGEDSLMDINDSSS